MIRSKAASFTILLFTLVMVFAITGHSQATRTWVSGVGDDVNPCSRTAPCKTFAGAISKTAVGGEINCLDPAGYGAVTIVKSITIDCTGTLGSILAAGTTGVIINVADTDASKTVRLRGFSINGAGTGTTGVRVIAGNKVSIENLTIDGFTLSGVSIENTAGTAEATINSSTFRNNKIAGITVNSTGGATAFVGTSLIIGNGTGVRASAKATIRISNTVVTRNTTGISATDGGSIISFGNNAIAGNGTDGAATSTAGLK